MSRKSVSYDARKQERRLESVYIGVVGSGFGSFQCRDSWENIKRRSGDSSINYMRATKGYEARQGLIESFLDDKQYGYILLLDHDMLFTPDTLERLRSHGLPYVSGYYMRRMIRPIAPVMHEYQSTDTLFPYAPLIRDLDRGDEKSKKLHRLGASGWGCMLVHREVFEAVRPLLKGEDFVIEDDMDIYPYDLPKLIAALNALKEMREGKINRALFDKAVDVLGEEIRVLKGTKSVVGSDLRFPFFAQLAGYDLYIDTEIRPGHMVEYPVSADDYSNIWESQIGVIDSTRQLMRQGRSNIKKYIESLNSTSLAEIKEKEEEAAKKLKELEAAREELDKQLEIAADEHRKLTVVHSQFEIERSRLTQEIDKIGGVK
jgi:hypothetical protein